MDLDRALFFGLWMRRPLDIAAVLPSGRAVGDACARNIDLHQPGCIVELGAGTGSLTRRLIDAGCPTERIVAIEREMELVGCLRRGLPGLRVVAGDVTQLAQVLAEAGIDRIAAVLSSLPIKWFPLAAQRAVIEPCFARMGGDGRFLQITNAFASPLAAQPLGLIGRRIELVWRNLPPVQVWSYLRRTS